MTKKESHIAVLNDKLDLLANMARLNIELQEILLRELGSQKGLIISITDNWEIQMYNPTNKEIKFFEEIISPHDTLKVKTVLSA